MQGQGKAPGVTRNAIEIKGQLGEESRLGLRHAMGSGMPVLLWMYKSRGDYGAREGEFRPGGPPHIPGRGGGQGRETQEDQGNHQGVQDGPIQGRGGHPFGMDRPKAMPGGCNVVKRKEGPGPLFRFEDGRPLTRPRLVREVKRALDKAGASSTGILGHSFRIGAATTAVEQGVEDSTIKDLGRWRSNAFQRYIRRNRASLAGYWQGSWQWGSPK